MNNDFQKAKVGDLVLTQMEIPHGNRIVVPLWRDRIESLNAPPIEPTEWDAMPATMLFERVGPNVWKRIE